jgi:hypothetical protein
MAAPMPCVAFSQEEKAAFQRELQSKYQAPSKGYSLRVELAACEVEPEKIFIDTGVGHSSRIVLYELSRKGSDVSLSRVALQGFGFVAPPKSLKGFRGEYPYPVELQRATIPKEKLDALWVAARLAVGASLTEVAPPVDPSKGFSLSLSGTGGSSADFLVRVELNGKESSFVGYEGGSSQLKYLPASLVKERLDAVLKGASLTVAPLDEEARRLFVSRFEANQRHFSDDYNWWVKETFLSSFGAIGEPLLAKRLLPYLTPTSESGSEERVRYQAINAAAALTGKDLRYDASGAERPTTEVAAEYTGLLVK